MILICVLYYQNEKRLYVDLTKSTMQNIVSEISSKIIFAHMTDNELDTSGLLSSDKYKLSFYNQKKQKMFGNLDDEIDFSKNIIQHKEHFILVDHSTLGHLGVFHIAIEENLYFKQIRALQVNIVMFFMAIYAIIALIGFYLAKLFLKPIKEERDKLNNFIKDTTHELNTPISAILMSTENESLSEKQIQRVRLSAHRISEIYKDLTYVFLQKNEIKKEIQELSLNKLLLEQLEYFEPLVIKKKISMIVELNDLKYKIDKDDFIRLFNNLISNAIKYNKMGGSIEITIKYKQLIIKDSGIGIKEDKLNDIFKRYFRGTSVQGGFGIGLNIVSHICNTYNIDIQVESTYKQGTAFILDF